MKANLKALREISTRGELWPVGFLAHLAGVSPRRIYNLCESGSIPVEMVQGWRFVPVSKLLEHYEN